MNQSFEVEAESGRQSSRGWVRGNDCEVGAETARATTGSTIAISFLPLLVFFSSSSSFVSFFV